LTGGIWYSINLIITIIVFVTVLSLALYTYTRHKPPKTTWLSLLLVGTAWVSACVFLEQLYINDLDRFVTFAKFEYIGLTTLPVIWLGVALVFSDRENLITRRRMALLLIVPLTILALAFTNELHGLIWAQPRLVPSGDYLIYSPDYGPAFWIFTIYSYVVFMAGSYVLVRGAANTWYLFRLRSVMLLTASILPWLSNLFEIFDPPFLEALNLNVPAFGFSATLLTLALFRYHLIDLIPFAYDSIISQVPDGLIVLDHRDRIITINPVVANFVRSSPNLLVGKTLHEVFPDYEEEILALKGMTNGRRLIMLDDRVIEIRISPVAMADLPQNGRLLVLRDVSAQIENERSEREDRVFAEMMVEIGALLNSTLATEKVLERIVQSIQLLLPGVRANVMLLEDDRRTLRIRHHSGYGEAAARLFETLAFDIHNTRAFRESANAPEPLIINDVRQFEGWTIVPELSDIYGAALIPLHKDDELVGFLSLDAAAPNLIRPEVAPRLKMLAQHADLAFKNARLYEQTQMQQEELRERVERLTITQRVYKEIGFSFNLDSLLEIAFDGLLRMSRADAGFIALMNDQHLVLQHYYGRYEQDALQARLAQRSGIIWDVLHDPDSPRVAHSMMVDTLLPDDICAQMALPLRTFDGSERETLHGVIMLESRDVNCFTTERTQLLELVADRIAVALQNSRLFTTSQERAAQLERLYAQMSRLEQLKSEMIRIAAHDLKNPLSVILNYLTLLTEDSSWRDNPEEIYESMARAGNRMNQIIKDFLSLERIEQIAEQQTSAPFDLGKAVRRAVDEFMARARVKQQTLTLQISDDPCIINGDEVQIYEAITNFISNAIKYTPDEGTIVVSLVNEEYFAEFTVTDSGYGIPEDRQKRLFQPFYRVKTSEVEKVEGTGLGLHLARNIVERHGGSIIFRSVYRQGSTFGFRLPLYQPSEKQDAEAQPSAAE
jgi:signal transduction histidine kinase/PAS domain-containing protein